VESAKSADPYEFHGSNDLSGARRPTGTRVEDVFRSVRKGKVEVLLAPDRRREDRGRGERCAPRAVRYELCVGLGEVPRVSPHGFPLARE
jgi:hypothetical protein